MTTTNTRKNSPDLTSAIDAIRLDPAAALAQAAAGSASSLSKSLGLRIAAAFMASQGAQAKTRDAHVLSALGDAPDSAALAVLASRAVAKFAVQHGANADRWAGTDTGAKSYRRKVAAVTLAALALMHHAPNGLTVDLLTSPEKHLAALGYVLVGTSTHETLGQPLDKWEDLPERARAISEEMKAKDDAARQRRAARPTSGGTDTDADGGNAADRQALRDAEASMAAIEASAALAAARIRAALATARVSAATRAALSLAIADCESVITQAGGDPTAASKRAVERLAKRA